ncbi:HPP family protein [Aspergillus niger]|uniref:HPP family protein n=1 Tax=Aspergillus niger TaxID=5061 RepID=A0A505IPS9_ASPNG|nr:HPP family protein [Aspergillus niger]
MATERDLFAVQLARVGSQAARAANEPRPYFEDWTLAMHQKLDTNAGHYSTTILRKAYNIFSDPNKERNARRQYNNLKIAPEDKFYTFISNFRYLAVEAGIDPDCWREDLYQRLPFKLQELTISRFNDNEVDFDQYVEECARSADLIDEILKRCNCTGQTPSSGRRQSLNAPTTANRTSPAIKTEEAPSATSETSMDTETRNRLMNEGKCFRCQRPRISAVIVLTRNPYK